MYENSGEFAASRINIFDKVNGQYLNETQSNQSTTINNVMQV